MRLATFNILHGRSLTDGRVDLDRVRRAVRELDADILGLQEVDRDQPRSHLADLSAEAASAMGAVCHRHVAALAGTPGAEWTAATGSEQPGAPTFGIALLSRYPVQRWHVVRMPRIPVRVPVWLRSVGRVTSIREEPRVALIGEFASPSGPLVVMTTHLGFVPGWNGRQLRALCRRLAGFQAPVVILGDLNMHNPRAAQRMDYRQLATLRTYPGNEPRRQLDHILLRGDLGRIVSTSAPAFAVSDHRALTVEILVDDRMSGEHAAGERTVILEG